MRGWRVGQHSGTWEGPLTKRMAVCAAEHHARKVGLGETRDTALAGRGRSQCGRNVLQGGGSSNSTIWFRDVGPLGSHGEEGRRDT